MPPPKRGIRQGADQPPPAPVPPPLDEAQRAQVRESFLPMFTKPEVLEAYVARFSRDYPIGQNNDPQGVMMRAATRNFLRFETGRPITGGVELQAERDKWNLQHGGWAGMDDRQSFNLIGNTLRRDQNTQTALGVILPNITLDTLKAHTEGTSPSWLAVVDQWQKANPALARNVDETRLLQAASQYARQQAALMQAHGEAVHSTLTVLGHAPGQAEADETAIGAMASQLQGKTPAERHWIYQTAGTYAQSQPPSESYLSSLGQAFQRGGRGMASSVLRNARQLQLANEIGYLEERQRGGAPLPPTLPAMPDPLGGMPSEPAPNPYAELDLLPPEKIASEIARRRDEYAQLDLEREVRSAANGVIDPLRPTAEGWLGAAQQASFGVAEGLPVMAMAALPGVGSSLAGGVLFSQNYDQVHLKYPDLPAEQAIGLAAATTAAQTVALNLAVGKISQSMPATSQALQGLKNLTAGQRAASVARNALAVGVANEGSLAAPAVVEGLAKALGMDLPGYDAEKEFHGFLEAQPETVVMMLLPWTAASGGVAVRKLFPRLAEQEQAQMLIALGYPADRAQAIAAEKDPARQRALQAAEWARIPEEVKLGLIRRVDAHNLAVRQSGELPATPSIVQHTEPDAEGRKHDRYEVFYADGSLAYSTSDAQAAETVRQSLAEDDLLFSKKKYNDPPRASWNDVRKGDRWDYVKGLYRKQRSDATAPILRVHGQDEYVERALKFIRENPVVKDWEGRSVYLPYGDNGPYTDRVRNRAYHLTGSETVKGSHVRELRIDKAELLMATLDTIRNGDVRVRHKNEILYFKRYGPVVHMVTTSAEGVVVGDQKFDSGLVTQYPVELNKKEFDGARVDSIRPPVATPDETRASRSLAPATAATDSAEMAPSSAQRIDSNTDKSHSQDSASEQGTGRANSDPTQIQATVEGLTKDWKNAPAIEIAHDVDSLGYRDETLQRLKEEKPEAFYDRTARKVVLLPENFRPEPGESMDHYVARKVLHEVVGHGGLHQLFSGSLAGEYDRIVDGVLASRGGQFDQAFQQAHGYENMQALADHYGFDLQTREGQRGAAEEYLARMAEQPNAPTWVHHTISAITSLMRKMGFSVWTDADTKTLLQRSRQSVENGKSISGAGQPDGAASELRQSRPIASEVSGDYGAHKLAAPRGLAYMSKDEQARDPAVILQDLLRGSSGATQSQRRKHGRELSSGASLMAWADLHGRNFRSEHFSIPSTFDGGGGEHAVVFDKASGRMLKLTKSGLFGAQAEDAGRYLERWALSNRVFGDDVKVEGMVQLPGENERRVVISQPYIKGRDATAAEQEDFLKGKGFVEVDGKWVHPVTGVSVWDTQTPGNVIVSPDGSYHAVDLQIGPAGAEELKAARDKSGIGGELKFSK